MPPVDVFETVPELASAASLADVLARWGRNVGATRMRAAIPQIRQGVESPMETLTRLVIVDAGFPEPLVGYRVHAGQVFIGRVDLAYPELKIAVEYDGEYHWDPEQAKKDVARINRLQEAGWLVIRITIDDLFKRRATFFAQLGAARNRPR
ncbi:endonuclease domain-containing protein [Pseudoclavibacter helvolus]|uniref:endonuclease domain-containing protein n=1 Tax=Pseudoclavibacter helvolus TaxID=255205 RepID=UPI003C7274B4